MERELVYKKYQPSFRVIQRLQWFKNKNRDNTS